MMSEFGAILSIPVDLPVRAGGAPTATLVDQHWRNGTT